jgi:DNA replication protein DnaC
MAEICSICGGSGLRVVQQDGRQFAQDCVCRVARRAERMLQRALLPKKFQFCSFENYETMHDAKNTFLAKALFASRRFVEGYPLENAGKGLLFTGSSGLGKTHLAVSILRSLILEKGATGVFWEHKQFLEELKAIYTSGNKGAEDKLLKFATQCDVLVIDDLGDITPSDWSWDTTSHILNARYNENLSTIVTTNLENRPGILGNAIEPVDRFSQSKPVMTRQTLGDRIGERMRSRLQEMCVVVEMQGEDFRQKVKRASFG